VRSIAYLQYYMSVMWRTTHEYSYIPCKAPDSAFPCRVTSSAAREAKELASGPHSGWYRSVTANLGAIKCFTIVSRIEVERYYEYVANENSFHCTRGSAKPGENLECTVRLNCTRKIRPAFTYSTRCLLSVGVRREGAEWEWETLRCEPSKVAPSKVA
jgi:hypothetical protein